MVCLTPSGVVLLKTLVAMSPVDVTSCVVIAGDEVITVVTGMGLVTGTVISGVVCSPVVCTPG